MRRWPRPRGSAVSWSRGETTARPRNPDKNRQRIDHDGQWFQRIPMLSAGPGERGDPDLQHLTDADGLDMHCGWIECEQTDWISRAMSKIGDREGQSDDGCAGHG